MIVVELSNKEDHLRFLALAEDVYKEDPCWVREGEAPIMGFLDGSAPFCRHCQTRAFGVEENGRLTARALAQIDSVHNDHWREAVGHIFYFEALADRGNAAKMVLEAACDWLKTNGCTSARLSYLTARQLPLTIDAYDSSPTTFHGYNPPYYHNFIKSAGFQTDQGFIEYKIEFTDEIVEKYGWMMSRAKKEGIRFRKFDFDKEEDTRLFLKLHNASFTDHYGAVPLADITEARVLLHDMRDVLVPEFIQFAELDGNPIAYVYGLPDFYQAFKRDSDGKPGQIDTGLDLSVGVLKEYRTSGIGQAIAAVPLKAMANQGYRFGKTTLVLDSNWGSRGASVSLGGEPVKNFVTYRKTLR